MSHFVGLCFGGNWENDLEQYWENLEVEGYVEYTKEEAIEQVQKQHPKSYLNAIKELQNGNLSSNQMEYYQRIVQKGPSISKEDAWKEVLEWGYELDEDENLISKYNPNSKWDWYSLGGRWPNYLYLKECDKEGERFTADQAYFDEVDWDYMIKMNRIPFCFVDWDGDWHEKGEMGWFAMTKNEKDKDSWADEFKAYIETLKNIQFQGEVTVIDFHI